ncbi:MAG: hypothetical protein ND895_17400 [Pyrinomonadaceae bacterium]|nr:hypothetical protein [Pyrinomonadaceae bacterium]
MNALLQLAPLFGLYIALITTASAQQTTPRQDQGPSPSQTPATQSAIEEWGDDFDSDKLDEAKWEPYTFEGGGGGKVEVKDKQLKMRGAGGSRSGVRSKREFHGERFYVEAALGKVGIRTPQPGEEAFPPGFAIVSVLFDGNTINRIEWLLRSDGIFEAWQCVDGRMIRVDNGKLATKEKTPKLGIARRGDKVYFMLNREVGLETTIRGVSSNFKVMLYGFGSSENNWDSIAVQTLKQ